MKKGYFKQLVCLAVIVVLGLIALSTWAQDAAPKQAPIIPDPEILKRTPTIDGAVIKGEWDIFQNFKIDDWEVATYANWDSKNVYFAVTSTKPCDAMMLIDANDDGWFHGEDNYEFRAVRQADGSLAKQVLRYESRNTTTIAPSAVSENESSQVEMKSSVINGVTHIELRVPEYLIRDFKLADNKKVGLQIAVRTAADETSWIPETVRAESKQCVKSTLVSKKASALSPLAVTFGIKDPKVTRGEDIQAVLQINNQGVERVDVTTINMAGDGLAAGFMDSMQRREDGIEPKKQIKEEMKGSISKSMPLGTWVVGAEIFDKEKKIGAALASFDVLDQFEANLRLPKTDVATTTEEITISVAVKNNMRKPLWGKVKLTLPLGWELRRGIDTRDYTVRTRNGEAIIAFRAKPPIGALGAVPVKAVVTGADTQKELEGIIRVVTPK